MTKTLSKFPGESRGFCVDFSPKLAKGEVLNAVDQILVDPHPLTVDNTSLNGPKAQFVVQVGGVANQKYHLLVRVTTNAGRKLEALCPLLIRRPYPDLFVLIGEDYLTAESRNFQFMGAEEWPADLDGYTITMTLKSAFLGVTLAKVGSVVTATGTQKKVAIELVTAETETLAPGGYRYDVQATLDGDNWTLAAGYAVVEQDQTP
jgi:hypothetical protein